MTNVRVIDTHPDDIHEYGMCGYKNKKIEGFKRKIEWVKQRFSEGMRYKILYSDEDGTVGAIEYIPGKYAWRPVDARGYMFIHCLFIIPRNYKKKGYGSLLVEACVEDAKKENMHGVAVVTRKGTWMVGKELFEKNGFKVVDKAPPDFELLVNKLDSKAPPPKFKGDREKKLSRYKKGLTIITSDQCPYTEKAVREIRETAEKLYGLKSHIVELRNHKEAQETPCPFGTFCMVYNGKVIADHPTSKTRFKNIMNKILE